MLVASKTSTRLVFTIEILERNTDRSVVLRQELVPKGALPAQLYKRGLSPSYGQRLDAP